MADQRISKDLFLSILAMDAYNQGYGAAIADGNGPTDAEGRDKDGLGGIGSKIGSATVTLESDVDEGTPGVANSFDALSYDLTRDSAPEGLA